MRDFIYSVRGKLLLLLRKITIIFIMFYAREDYLTSDIDLIN